MTMTTLYKGSLQKVSFVLNVMVITILGLFILRSVYHHFEYPIISVLIWMTPFFINVKVLYTMKGDWK